LHCSSDFHDVKLKAVAVDAAAAAAAKQRLTVRPLPTAAERVVTLILTCALVKPTGLPKKVRHYR